MKTDDVKYLGEDFPKANLYNHQDKKNEDDAQEEE